MSTYVITEDYNTGERDFEAVEWIDNAPPLDVGAVETPDNSEDPVKPGDVFVTSWGYDQTNYDYIVVNEVSKTGKTCKCQRAHHNDKGFSGQCHIQEPTQEGFGDVFRMKVTTWVSKDEPALRGSYPVCGDGSMEHTRLDTFWKWDKQRTYAETDSMFGH